VSADHRQNSTGIFAWFETKLSPRPARFVRWLRKPSSGLGGYRSHPAGSARLELFADPRAVDAALGCC